MDSCPKVQGCMAMAGAAGLSSGGSRVGHAFVREARISVKALPGSVGNVGDIVVVAGARIAILARARTGLLVCPTRLSRRAASSPIGQFGGFKLLKSRRKYAPLIRATAGAQETLPSLSKAIETKDADAVKSALDELKQAGAAKQWDSLPSISRRTTYIRELTSMGIKNAEQLAIPSVRNDAAFLATVVGTTGFLGVLASQLPGDWGFFVPYLIGSISLVVLAVGSVAPGLLQAAIGAFSSVYPDYQERLLSHEAAHFLVAYLVGLPIVGYSIDIGKEHVNLLDEKLQERIYRGSFEPRELDKLAVVSMAGLAAEGLKYDKVVGQSADLYSLQRLINRSKPPLSNNEQQNLTRWAVLYAASQLKIHSKEFEALQQAMARKASVAECVEEIEKSPAPVDKCGDKN